MLGFVLKEYMVVFKSDYILSLPITLWLAVNEQRKQLCRITLPKQQRLKGTPNLLVAPMFAQDVGWVKLAVDEITL